MPDTIDERYQLIKTLGKGTFGEVFEVRDLRLDRLVALKRFSNETLADPEVRREIKNEARLMAQFKHSNILHVIDYHIKDNLGYIVTDLAEGGSLDKKISMAVQQSAPSGRPFSLVEVTNYLQQIASGLEEAHSKRVVHRDLKPANILLAKDGHAMIGDFGLAVILSDYSSTTLHREGGTPYYMAPEQWMKRPQLVSDVYALGIITFQLLTGKLPYRGSLAELMGQHCNVPMPLLSQVAPELTYSSTLDDVIAAATDKVWRNRTRSPLEFYEHFREAVANISLKDVRLSPPPDPNRPDLPKEESSRNTNSSTKRLLKQAKILRAEQHHRLKAGVDNQIRAIINHDLKDLDEKIQKFENELKLNSIKPNAVESLPNLPYASIAQSSSFNRSGKGLETEGKATRIENPFMDIGPVRKDYFIWPDALAKTLRSDLKFDSVSVWGKPKIGKSSLLWLFYQEQQEQNKKALFCDMQEFTKMQELVDKISGQLELSPGLSWSELEQHLLTQPFYLFLDNFDNANRIGFDAEWNQRIQDLLDKNYRFWLFISSSQPLAEIVSQTGQGSEWYKKLKHHHLQGFSTGDAEKLLTSRLPVESVDRIFPSEIRSKFLQLARQGGEPFIHPFKFTLAARHYYDYKMNNSSPDWEAAYNKSIQQYNL
ncbi:MAG: serine/threonine protein kinase [Chloroflexi bacterium]|nr:serine/threonine protein kinase [Chloroflexota bacterium]